jgi:hypothetical protein
MSEQAHILFPDDAPAPAQAPDWFTTERAAAEMRLMGSQKQGGEKSTELSAGESEGDAASKIFSDEKQEFDAGVVEGFLNSRALSARSDGDHERAEALKAATSALTDDFRANGTSSRDAEEAFQILREANDYLTPPSPEQIATDMTANLATLQSELGSSFQSDLDAARAFISDLNKVAPGTIESLSRNGAGNDLRLVKAAIREARRRGY